MLLLAVDLETMVPLYLSTQLWGMLLFLPRNPMAGMELRCLLGLSDSRQRDKAAMKTAKRA
jgi:hypothetical protein